MIIVLDHWASYIRHRLNEQQDTQLEATQLAVILPSFQGLDNMYLHKPSRYQIWSPIAMFLFCLLFIPYAPS